MGVRHFSSKTETWNQKSETRSQKFAALRAKFFSDFRVLAASKAVHLSLVKTLRYRSK